MELDTATLEGKASLSKLAMPLVDQIPEGVFKQLMVSSLSKRVGLSSDTLLSASAVYERRKPTQAGPIMPTSKKSALALGKNDAQKSELSGQIDQAISMLLKQPELADLFKLEEYSIFRTDENLSLLVELIDFIFEQDDLSLNVIFDHFNGRPISSRLQQLANKEQLLDVSQFADEFKGIVRLQLSRLEDELKKTNIEGLLQKPISALSREERELILRYHHEHGLKDV